MGVRKCDHLSSWGGKRPSDECEEPCVEGLVVCLMHASKNSMYLVIQTQAKEIERLTKKTQEIEEYFREATQKFGW